MVFGMCTPEERRFSIFSLETARLIAQHILGDKRAGSGGSVAHRFLRLAPNLLAPCGPFEPRLLPHTRLRYFCSPQHTDSALYPIISQMERAAGFAHDDTAQAKLDKLDALLAQSLTPRQDAERIAEMLSLPNDGRYPTLELDPQQRRQKTLEATRDLEEAKALLDELHAIAGNACLVTRSGYTGEDGFEISVAASEAEKLAREFLEDASVAFAGLGARDSLRTEAGLCLYGLDLDENTTPAEAALEGAIQKVRRRGGARSGGFPDADVVLRQLDDGPARRRVGLRPQGRESSSGGVAL